VRLWIGTFALLFLVTFTPATVVVAQRATQPLLSGRVLARARVGVTLRGAQREEGQLHSLDSAAVVLRTPQEGLEAGTISRTCSPSTSAVVVAKPPNKGVAILLGAVIGAVLGGAVGYVMTRDNPEDPGIGMFIGLPVGALVGGLVGFVATTGDSPQRWDSIALQR